MTTYRVIETSNRTNIPNTLYFLSVFSFLFAIEIWQKRLTKYSYPPTNGLKYKIVVSKDVHILVSLISGAILNRIRIFVQILNFRYTFPIEIHYLYVMTPYSVYLSQHDKKNLSIGIKFIQNAENILFNI